MSCSRCAAMHSFIHSNSTIGGDSVQATVSHLDGANGRKTLGTVSSALAFVFSPDELTLSLDITWIITKSVKRFMQSYDNFCSTWWKVLYLWMISRNLFRARNWIHRRRKIGKKSYASHAELMKYSLPPVFRLPKQRLFIIIKIWWLLAMIRRCSWERVGGDFRKHSKIADGQIKIKRKINLRLNYLRSRLLSLSRHIIWNSVIALWKCQFFQQQHRQLNGDVPNTNISSQLPFIAPLKEHVGFYRFIRSPTSSNGFPTLFFLRSRSVRIRFSLENLT